MNYRKMTRPALVTFATNTSAGVAGGKVSEFLPAQNTAIADAIADATTALAAADQTALDARTAALAATELANEKAATLVKLLSELKFAMRGVDAPPDQYDALGFTPPDTVRSIVTPQRPTDLSATGFSYGVNQLVWTGNNPSGSVVYAIEVKIGDTAPYVLLTTATAQKWKHEGVTPGQFYQYRVRAQAARNLVSDWSNEAVVYGSQPDAV
jgi:hypothetical protein